MLRIRVTICSSLATLKCFQRCEATLSAPSAGEWRSKVKNLRRRIVKDEDSSKRKDVLEGSLKVVGLAICSNGLMFGAKTYGAIQSGSASMYAEALHSLADCMNECLLMVGIMRSIKSPTGGCLFITLR
jgi:hypothetical protein